MSTPVDIIEQIDIHDHLCLIYRNQAEEFATDIPFLKAGLRLNDQCVYINEESPTGDVLSAMKHAGVDVEKVILSGQFVMLSEQNSYLQDGVHDPDSTIKFFTQASIDSQANGFRALRGVGEMAWSLGHKPGSERLIEYEAKLNYFIPRHPVMAICQYNMERFSPEVIRNVLFTHPKVIINNLLCDNVFYKPPGEVLNPRKSEARAAVEVKRMLNHLYDQKRSKLELERKVLKLEQEVVALRAKAAVRKRRARD